jgi:uncharacterized protein YxeA
MKKIIFASSLLTTIVITFFACQKKEVQFDENFVLKKNEAFVKKLDNGGSITATDVYSKINSFRRAINIDAGPGKGKLPEIYLTFLSNDDENIYEKMKNNPYTVNGEFTVEAGGQVILRKKVVNGQWQKSDLISLSEAYVNSEPPHYNPNLKCTVKTVHDCVAWEIDDMNWIEYGLCLASAPGCYAGLWASCTWEVCHNHMEYKNPN